MVFKKFLGQSFKMGGLLEGLDEKEATTRIESLESAFFQISSVFSVHKDLNTILEHVVQESFNCLRANRTIG